MAYASKNSCNQVPNLQLLRLRLPSDGMGSNWWQPRGNTRARMATGRQADRTQARARPHTHTPARTHTLPLHAFSDHARQFVPQSVPLTASLHTLMLSTQHHSAVCPSRVHASLALHLHAPAWEAAEVDSVALVGLAVCDFPVVGSLVGVVFGAVGATVVGAVVVGAAVVGCPCP